MIAGSRTFFSPWHGLKFQASEVRSDVQVEQPMRQTAAGRWRLSGNASQANGPGFPTVGQGFPTVGQGFPAVSTVGSSCDHFSQFPKQFVRASDMQMSTKHQFCG